MSECRARDGSEDSTLRRHRRAFFSCLAHVTDHPTHLRWLKSLGLKMFDLRRTFALPNIHHMFHRTQSTDSRCFTVSTVGTVSCTVVVLPSPH